MIKKSDSKRLSLATAPILGQPPSPTIFVEEAVVLSHEHLAGEQHILRVEAPLCAGGARPGNFAHLQCHASRPMRRPISIMRTSAKEGWVDFLYKAVGDGTRLLAQRKPGESISQLGPIGTAFELHTERSRPLLIGGGVGMPPVIFLAATLRNNPDFQPFVILGSEVPFPFKARASRLLVAGMLDGVTASMPLLDDWQIPCRLASLQGYAGCYQGFVTELASIWFDKLEQITLNQVEIFCCGPHLMLEAVAKLAASYNIPCQVSLEEYMACAVGGCAGCVVPVATADGPAMKRVCVDGPVFDARHVFPT